MTSSVARSASPTKNPLRAHLDRRLRVEIDPDGTMPADEYAERLKEARAAYFTGLGAKSIETRAAIAILNRYDNADFTGIQILMAQADAANKAAVAANDAMIKAVNKLIKDFG